MSAHAKEEKEPSLSGSLIIVAFVASFGALLAAVFLLTFEAENYASIAEQEETIADRESVHRLHGDASNLRGSVARTNEWQKRRNEFLSGSASVSIPKYSDLNGWFKAMFSNTQTSDESSGLILTPGTLNVCRGDFVLAIVGVFTDTTPPSSIIERLRLNSAKLPLAGALGEKFLPSILCAFEESDELESISKAWTQVRKAEPANGALTLTF